MRNSPGALGLAFLLCGGLAEAQSGIEAARRHRAEHGPAIVRELGDFARLPNVASDDAAMRRNAAWIVERFRERGVELELLELPGAPPVVTGRIAAPGATRTLGLYVHYDGQPVQEERWSHSPWQPVLYTRAMEAGGEPRDLPADGEAIDPEWRLYARSVADDKAPIVALLAALDALRAAGIAPTSNLLLFFEGEEEAGSPHLAEFLARYRGRLQADLWLFCDGPVHSTRRPQLVFGVRGISALEITVYGASRNLHSGHYGNWSPNPAMLLAQLLASMKNADGSVLIEGFYDTVAQPGEAELRALAAFPDTDGELKAELGLASTEGGGASLAERLLLPSLNVRGFESGAVGERARNLIPSTATASLDVRLVPGNDPARMLDRVEAHIRGQGYHIVRADPSHELRLRHPRIARVLREVGYPAYRSPMDHALVPLLSAAMREAAGAEPLLNPGLGGSLPLYRFRALGEVPVMILPMANHDNNQHAPNENLRLANLWYGIDLLAGVLTLPAQEPTESRNDR